MRLAEIFTSDMVIQRDMPIRIFGYGKGHIKIELCGVTKELDNTKDEKWELEFESLSAGGPFEIKVDANSEKNGSY
ncbi:MAG: hypothetical protein E7588_03865 [Ruminococcaceae bacterium]|nr:hypothetical protein [Oscillospiraceae bacterium]